MEAAASADAIKLSNNAVARSKPNLLASTYNPLGSFGPGGMGAIPKGADPDTQKRPPMIEFGAPGVAIIAGLIQGEEYNPSLSGREGLRVWDKMRRSDPIVRQTILLNDVPIRAAKKKIAPASPDPKHIEQASFTETAMFHNLEGQSFDDVVQQVLLYRPFGFMLLEKVFKQMEDGSIQWQKFAPRLPKTIMRWWENKDKELAGVQQWAWNPTESAYTFINIPAANLLRFTYQQEGNNYPGISVLRSVHGPWWQKQAYLKLQAVGFQREHVGIPAISLPDGYSDADITRAGQIGRNARSNEIGYILIPPGWAVEWVKARGGEKKGSSIQDAMIYLDQQIQNACLAGFIGLGQSGTGSYAASTDQSTLLLKANQGDAAYVSNVFTMDAIPQLEKFNFRDADMYSRLVFQNVQAFNIKEVVKALSEAAIAGVLRPSVEVEDFIYDLLGIPTAPANLVESTIDGYGSGKRLPMDATGKTPLPLTPEEEIALANRQAKDLQKISVQSPGGTGSSSDRSNRSAVQDASRATPARGSRSGTTDGGSLIERPNDIYITHLAERTQRYVSPLQQRIYLRMAAEAGRPVIRLRGDYEFASATQLSEKQYSPEQASRLARRRSIVADISGEVREAAQLMRRELHDELEAKLQGYVDQRVDDATETV